MACQRKRWWCALHYGGGKGPRSVQLEEEGAKLPTVGHPTHQWRGDTLEEPMEALFACDGHQRVKGGAVSCVRRWVLEPVFHLIIDK